MFEMPELVKQYAAFGAIALSIPTYWIYFHKIIQGTAKPHVLTWVILASLTMSASILQFVKGAGLGAAPTAIAAVAGYIIAFMAWRRGYMSAVKRIDQVVAALAVVAWVVWLLAGKPWLAITALSVASVLAFTPTIRKSWNAPQDEPVSKYVLSTLRYALATVAVEQFSYVTGSYPLLWVWVNGLFVVMLLVRQQRVTPVEVARTVHYYAVDRRHRAELAFSLACCGGPRYGLPLEQITGDPHLATCNDYGAKIVRWEAHAAAA